jgi:hypothetical protein
LGVVDIDSLFRIYNQVKKIIKKHELLFSFKIDTGSYETAIEFIKEKPYHPPISKDWSNKPLIFCPDLLDWHNKIIIEFEEEVGNKRPGAKLAKKGHHREGDMDNKRDTRRTIYYETGGFHTLRIWESDEFWKIKLEKFLLKI